MSEFAVSQDTVTTVLRRARVFDGRRFLDGQHDLVLRAGTIESVTPSPAAIEVHDPRNEVVTVECAGRTVTPGFIDAHVHLMVSSTSLFDIFDKPFSLPYYESVGYAAAVLRSGVTTTRDAGFADAGMRAAIDRGIIAGPRMKISISIVSTTGGHGDLWLQSGIEAEQFMETPGRPNGVADGVDEVLKTTRRLFRAGADQIKICSTGGVLSPNDHPEHSQYSVTEIRTIVDEAEAHGSYVMSHAIGATGIRNALAAGVRSIEHGMLIDDEGLQLMLDTGAFLVPTLTAPRQVLLGAEQGVQVAPAMLDKAKRMADLHLASFARAAEVGVRIAMGSDAGVGPQGTSLDELAVMAEGGMSLERVLAAGTSEAAVLLQEGDRIGSLAPGYLADLVLLDLDLTDTGQLGGITDRVANVWKGGARVA
ncbi:metal-dependent hydrolase family protein [Agromyces neolithicus]|uniref:Amidohydrolase family protein n=1 Tax=Agromyces neolithicus TaxID=269420 RepID=A0ABN2M4N4_9MICO